MGKYRDNPAAVAALVDRDRVHRDVYIDQEVFALEMENLWRNTWIYVGHDSQVPNPGDYYTTEIATQPVIMVRHSDRTVRVLMNRCSHKGTRLVTDSCGNTGKVFRCPSHAGTFKTPCERRAEKAKREPRC